MKIMGWFFFLDVIEGYCSLRVVEVLKNIAKNFGCSLMWGLMKYLKKMTEFMMDI